jgi:hypothetical protein
MKMAIPKTIKNDKKQASFQKEAVEGFFAFWVL